VAGGFTPTIKRVIGYGWLGPAAGPGVAAAAAQRNGSGGGLAAPTQLLTQRSRVNLRAVALVGYHDNQPDVASRWLVVVVVSVASGVVSRGPTSLRGPIVGTEFGEACLRDGFTSRPQQFGQLRARLIGQRRRLSQKTFEVDLSACLVVVALGINQIGFGAYASANVAGFRGDTGAGMG
jgi:hypothetical protein